jgi:hypothetical protein
MSTSEPKWARGIGIIMKTAVMLFAALMLTACGPDPADVALLERTTVADAIRVGQSFIAAQPALEKIGYRCEIRSGSFTVESGQTSSAPRYLWCEKGKEAGFPCSVKVQVIVVPQSETIEQVHFVAGDECL